MGSDGEHPMAARCAGVAVWMGVWWLTEVVPLAVTALLPLVLFPVLGVMSASRVAANYTNDVIFLFLGGFMVALAMERWDLHKRIALHVILLIRGSVGLTLLGFMVATAFLSMWISNTAATMMMVPIASAVLARYDVLLGKDASAKIAVGLLLGIAYAASIGGIATLVGTPPNLVFVQLFKIEFPNAPEISFATWLFFAFPLTVMLLFAAWGVLRVLYVPKVESFSSTRDVFRGELRELGTMRREEKVVAVVFAVMAMLWITRRPLTLGAVTIPGWSELLPEPGYVGDGTVALALACVLFLISAKDRSTQILDWETARKLPWRIVLLFGGGFALAGAILESGLSEVIGLKMHALAALSPTSMTASVCTLLTFVTELTSNTATTQIALPILAATAVAVHRNPMFLMIPATLSASCAFMMPVATPPNAIIFGTGRIKVYQMAKAGILLNLIGIVLITGWMMLMGAAFLGSGPAEFPAWAVRG
ncbi:MAG: SLC13/DASS family transporter [Calditrichaeota bacterium]|nr:SLC13/DASS family transporter [Calditrichota bacterium]MCB9368912.1 SLC13/DASS family transporter [Calditrichota bacterium]